VIGPWGGIADLTAATLRPQPTTAVSPLLLVIQLEATAQWMGEPYVQRKGVSKAQHLTTLRRYVAALTGRGDSLPRFRPSL
jgi:hypothetical protein